jgi:hypothetical protein
MSKSDIKKLKAVRWRTVKRGSLEVSLLGLVHCYLRPSFRCKRYKLKTVHVHLGGGSARANQWSLSLGPSALLFLHTLYNGISLHFPLNKEGERVVLRPRPRPHYFKKKC